MKIRIGFSTCPNDTFIFDALVNGRIDTQGIEYEPYLADVEDLNQKALHSELEVTKLSYHAYGHVQKQYKVLDAGSALGYGNGPLVVSRNPLPINQIVSLKIAIPGRLTTANLLFGIAFPDAKQKKEFLFSDIESAILSGQADLGVLIHETRFTYADRGLHLVEDLGAFWERKTKLPIPLGGIVVRRDMPLEIQRAIQQQIRQSLEYARENPQDSIPFMKCHAQDMREDIINKHIETFVNDFSVSLGKSGQKAVVTLLEEGSRAGLFGAVDVDIFV